MTESEKILTAVSRDFHQLKQLVVGNGTKKGSIMGRLEDIEETAKRIENKPESECYFFKWKAEQDKKRNFRIGDFANIIQVGMLLLIIYEMFFKGG